MIEVVKKFVEGGDALGGIPSVESVTEVEAGPLQRGKEWRRVVVDGPASSGTSQRNPPGTCSRIAPAIAPASSRRCSVRALCPVSCSPSSEARRKTTRRQAPRRMRARARRGRNTAAVRASRSSRYAARLLDRRLARRDQRPCPTRPPQTRSTCARARLRGARSPGCRSACRRLGSDDRGRAPGAAARSRVSRLIRASPVASALARSIPSPPMAGAAARLSRQLSRGCPAATQSVARGSGGATCRPSARSRDGRRGSDPTLRLRARG